MRKMSCLLLVFLVVPGIVFAEDYKGKCADLKGDFQKCLISVTAEHFQIGFKGEEHQDLNVTIPIKDIKRLSEGELAKRRWGSTAVSTALRGPVGLVGLVFKKKKLHIGIEYQEENQPKAVMVELKKKKGEALEEELTALTGLAVEKEEPKPEEVEEEKEEKSEPEKAS